MVRWCLICCVCLLVALTAVSAQERQHSRGKGIAGCAKPLPYFQLSCLPSENEILVSLFCGGSEKDS